jgi:hypothetical protein
MKSQPIGILAFGFQLLVDGAVDRENEGSAYTPGYEEDSIVLFGEVRKTTGGSIRAFEFD